jgi:hypothetical protein
LASPLQIPSAATDLISFLKALPDCRMRWGIRYPQWWMLLVAILSILSNQGSLMGMERFAKRHRITLNKLLGTDVAKPPSDSTFRLLLAQLGVEGIEALLQQWIAAQPGVTDTVNTGLRWQDPEGVDRCKRLRGYAFYRSGEFLLQQPGRGYRPKHICHRCRR